jgi:quercetin dioxygenase-like cupin family protein
VVLTPKGKGRVYEKMPGFHFEWLLQTEKFEMILVTVAPKAETGTMVHEGEEGHYVLEGELEISVGSETHHLKAGDAFWHESLRVHRWRNLIDGVTKVVSIAVPRTSVSKMLAD